jgi:hypothetical protein
MAAAAPIEDRNTLAPQRELALPRRDIEKQYTRCRYCRGGLFEELEQRRRLQFDLPRRRVSSLWFAVYPMTGKPLAIRYSDYGIARNRHSEFLIYAVGDRAG